MEGALRDPALPEPERAITREQAIAHQRHEHRAILLALPVVGVIVLEDVLHVVGMKDRVGPSLAQRHDVTETLLDIREERERIRAPRQIRISNDSGGSGGSPAGMVGETAGACTGGGVCMAVTRPGSLGGEVRQVLEAETYRCRVSLSSSGRARRAGPTERSRI